jgi:hypothetical protein
MKTLTDNLIIEICEKLQSEGVNPTQNAVREALGGGSFATIAPVIKKWREQQTENAELTTVAIPESVQTALSQLGGNLWKSAMSEAESRMTSERDAMAVARDELDKERSDYTDAIAILEKESVQKDIEISEIASKLALSDTENATLNSDKIMLIAEKSKVEAVMNERLNGLQNRLDDAIKIIDKFDIKNRGSD